MPLGRTKHYPPGKYVAICNTTNFDGHYVKVFDYPDLDVRVNYLLGRSGIDLGGGSIDPQRFALPSIRNQALEIAKDQDPTWWFLNRVDFVACVERVFPLQIFRPLVGYLQ